MKLIGGNISDTPVKNVRDGSAFNVGGGGSSGGQAAFLSSLGETDNQELAWLPGYLSSYTAGSRMILNSVASPATGVASDVYTLHYGTDLHTATEFPTFTGTPGDESSSEYLLFDGGNALTALESTFMKSIVQDNAAWSLIFAMFVVLEAGSDNPSIFNSNNTSYRKGAGLTMSPSEIITLQIMHDSGVSKQVSHTTTLTAGWHTFGLSIGEAATTGHIMIDGVSESFTSTYSSPTSTAEGILNIGCFGSDVSGAATLPNTWRMGDIIMWNAEIGSTALDAASAVLETKYGI